MLLLKYVAKLIKILRSGATPPQIAGGFVLGMIIGLTPIMTLHNLIVFILLIIINVNLSMAILGFAVFSGFAYLLDPLFHGFGYWLLVDVTALNGLWTTLYNFPVVALSRYNNTVVTGSFVSSLILLIPLYFLAKVFVVQYREKIDSRIQKLKIVQALKGSKLYSIYEKVKHLGAEA